MDSPMKDTLIIRMYSLHGHKGLLPLNRDNFQRSRVVNGRSLRATLKVLDMDKGPA